MMSDLLSQPIPCGRVAGIDYGRRRIGVAVCDAQRIIASPLCIHETSGDHSADAVFFTRLVTSEDLVGFVVGLPLHTDGSTSAMSVEVERFAAWLGRVTGLPVAFQDERYSSQEAPGMLAGVGLSRGKKKSRSDAVAAQVVLASWMERAAEAERGKPAAPALRLVVGCGYLGERVARLWLARGDRVVGVTRSAARAEALAAIGIEPLILDVTVNDPHWERLFKASPAANTPRMLTIQHANPTTTPVATIFWAVGFDRTAGGSSHTVHVTGLRKLLDVAIASGNSPRVILSSSTGVWGDEGGGLVSETTPVNPSREAGRVLVEAERLLGRHPAGTGTVLRFAGLYGPNRLPRLADIRAGRPITADPDSWLNLVHIDDAAAVVVAVVDTPSAGPLYVVSDGSPILRRDWYGRLATLAGGPPPTWQATMPRGRGGDKRIDSTRVWADLCLSPEHPDALAAIPGLIAET